MGQRYTKPKSKEVVPEVEVVLPPSLLLQIPTEIWNEQLGVMLTSDHYRMLWACGDRRLHRLLTKLKLSSMLVTERIRIVPEFLQIMCERTRRVLTLKDRPEPMATFPSQAVRVDGTFIDVSKDTLSFTQWPNLQSLRLVCARSTTHTHRMPFFDILYSLPSSLTELSLQDSYLQGYTPAKQGHDPVVVSRLLRTRLPDLVELDIRSYPLDMLLTMGTPRWPCVWPSNLTAMTLTLSPSSDNQEVLINYPPNLVILRLNLSSTAQFVPLVSTSTLPRSAQRLYLDRFNVNYDAPLPPGTIEFSAARIDPSYNNSPFALPKTIELLHPIPVVASKRFEPNVRAMAYFIRNDRMQPFDDQTAKCWSTFEDAMMGSDVDEVLIGRGGTDQEVRQSNLSQAAVAFAQPRVNYTFVDSFSAELVRTGLEELFAKIVSRTLRHVLAVRSATMVPHLLTHAKWLTTFRAQSEVASAAFVNFALDAFALPEVKPRLPHLLSGLVLCIDVETCTLLKSIAEEHPGFCLPAITSLTLLMDMSHLSCPELGTAIGTVFPNLAKLAFNHFIAVQVDLSVGGASYKQASGGPAHSKHLAPILSRMPKLHSLHISPSHTSKCGAFEEEASAYLSAIPLRIENVLVTINGGTSKRGK